ncbi:hypothetical protein EBR77_01420 [bacterium]|jgi:hypothetical protein|nr:hypothetical protein [bacterium]
MSSIFTIKIKKIIKIKKVLDFLKITFHKYAIIKTKNMVELDSNPVYRKDGYTVWYNGEKYWLFTRKDILAITNKLPNR